VARNTPGCLYQSQMVTSLVQGPRLIATVRTNLPFGPLIQVPPPRERVATVHHGITRCNGRICRPCGAIPQRLGFISSDEHVSRPPYPRAADPMLSFPPSCCCAVYIFSLHSCVERSTGVERLHLWRDYFLPRILQRVSKIKLGHALQQPGSARTCENDDAQMCLLCARCSN
jgi:hypothetical protein